VVIDNGVDFRLKQDVPLVVPEANKDAIANHKGLIANPNCTTIQAIVALANIHKKFGLDEFILVSFQATSGAGKKACIGLWDETKNIAEQNKGKNFDLIDKKINIENPVFGNQIAFNVIPKIGEFESNGYTSEEMKVVNETHKILRDLDIKISATCIRVPVFTSHSEAIYFKTKHKASVDELREVLKNSEGIVYSEDSFSLPIDTEGKDEVFVSRLRSDPSKDSSFWLWAVSDNLRKGAALNAVQIAECLL